MKRSTIFCIAGVASGLMLGGCASTDVQQLQSELHSEQAKRQELESTVESLQSKYSMQSSELQMKDSELVGYKESVAGPASLLPPNAKAGECYARAFIPPQYETVSKTVIAKEASTRLVASKPVFDWVEERVLVKEAAKRLEVVPAVYAWREEQVLTQEASEELVVEPAVYRNEQERILVHEAYTTWKTGRGPIERINEATGEIMCLVEVPAKYNIVTKKVLVSPATTRAVAIPATYKTVKKRVMVTPPRSIEVDVPAEYKTVRVRKLVAGGKADTVPVPETYQNVTQTRLVKEGRMEWKPILCETNTTPGVIRKLQSALRSAGYSPGAVDGVLGRQTMAAVTRYQRDNGMAGGKLTMESLRKLGVI